MARSSKISKYNQLIDVRLRTQIKQPDGTYKPDYNTTRFTTKFANIEAINSNQGYKEGVSEKDTYYKVSYEYASNRMIAITDQILWAGKVLKPVGDCIIEDFGNKRIVNQKAKYTSI